MTTSLRDPEVTSQQTARVRKLLDDPKRRVLLVIGALSAVVHGLTMLSGSYFSGSEIVGRMHLLPFSVLRDHPLNGLLHLHAQPPLYNVATAILLPLPRGAAAFLVNLVFLSCTVAVAVAAAGMLLEARVRSWVVFTVVTVGIVLDPAFVLYQTHWSYTLPTATLASLAGWTALRFTLKPSLRSGLAFSCTAMVLILTNSSFQIYTVAIAASALIWHLREHRRLLLKVFLPPLLVLGCWYGANFVRYGTTATSSWVGMNLARQTTMFDSRADVEALVKAKILTPLALVRPFNTLHAYKSLGPFPKTGVEALDMRFADGHPNFNNAAYLKISRAYLHNDLVFILHRPKTYLTHVAWSLEMWTLPTEQYFPAYSPDRFSFSGWTRFYDKVINLQTTHDVFATAQIISGNRPGLGSVSVTAVIETLLAVIAFPFLLFKRRRLHGALSAGLSWTAMTIISSLVLTSLIEAAENNRFRFELGCLPLVAATLSVCWLLEPTRFGRRLVDHSLESTLPER
ncbi:MAG: hypothetical protein WCL38_04455 [Actinomycetota bacterium]